MRTASTLTGLFALTLAAALPASAWAEDAATPVIAPPPVAAPAPRSAKRLEVGLTLLPMGLGKFTASPGGTAVTADAAFAYGLGVSAGYRVLPGLTVGLAPQMILNVKPKEDTGDAAKQIDLCARVAYSVQLVETIAVYAEALPGYSLIMPPDGDTAKGFVLALGAGTAIELADPLFASLGVGYELGFQKRTSDEGVTTDVKTRYLRVALGVGMRF